MSRLFYALELNPALCSQLEDCLRELRSQGVGGRYTRPENLHITLQFIGETDARHIPELIGILQQVAAAWPPFNLELAGLGTFGRHQDILWLGIKPNRTCNLLQQDLTIRLRQAGLPHESRPFRPHLTLVRQASLPAGLLDTLVLPDLTLPVSRVTLLESCLQQGRRRYLPLQRQALLVATQYP